MILRVCRRPTASAAGGLYEAPKVDQWVGDNDCSPESIAHRSRLLTGVRLAPFATGPYGSIVSMPTISRFLGLVIAMYFDDHGPPHFHARHADGEAKIRIDTLEPMDSSLGRRQMRLVLAWAELHQEELLENWRLARAGETLQEIEPLR